MIWLWVSLGTLSGLALLAGLFLVALYHHLLRRYLDFLVRVFEEKPFFIIPRGQPVPDAEDVRFPTADGVTLSGCYLRTSAPVRSGVILFGLEFGSNRWSCVPYCQNLLDNGFDVFAFESRGQGDSDEQAGYEPLQWVTDYEVRDVRAAIRFLKTRPDADPRGIGFFGISKGGSAGVLAAWREPYVRCLATDGMFATHTTMVPYMRKWVPIVSARYRLQKMLPTWYYAWLGHGGLRLISRQRGCWYPYLEHALPRLGRRPLFIIHGGADTYITPDMARALFRLARQPKELWVVGGAKHNQALHVAGEEYHLRVLEFFQAHLAEPSPARSLATENGRASAIPAPHHQPGVSRGEARAPLAERH